MKSKNAEAGNFGVNRNKTEFFNSFDSSRNSPKYQCLNCEAWLAARKFVPLGQYDQTRNRIAVFRFCQCCWRSYNRVSGDLRQEFISRILNKVRRASEVIIDDRR